MSYLIQNDFTPQIQPNNLNQLIGGNTSLLTSAMLDSETPAREYLGQKFDIDTELTSTDAYDPTKNYQALSRVYLDGSLYNAASSYALGAIVVFNGSVYKCISAITVPETFNPAHWLLLGAQYDIYNIALPYPLFDLNTLYKTGTQVFWKNNVYTCQIASLFISHDVALQLNYYSNVPNPNVFPDDPDNGVKYWGTPVPFSIAAGSLPTGWTAGDNRNRSLVRKMVAVALFYIHKRISPQNIPHHIKVDYMGDEGHGVATKDGYIYPDYSALGWMQSIALGAKPTVGLIPLQPRQGGRIRWGSKIRRQNGY